MSKKVKQVFKTFEELALSERNEQVVTDAEHALVAMKPSYSNVLLFPHIYDDAWYMNDVKLTVHKEPAAGVVETAPAISEYFRDTGPGCHVIFGRSGSGKSTFARSLAAHAGTSVISFHEPEPDAALYVSVIANRLDDQVFILDSFNHHITAAGGGLASGGIAHNAYFMLNAFAIAGYKLNKAFYLVVNPDGWSDDVAAALERAVIKNATSVCVLHGMLSREDREAPDRRKTVLAAPVAGTDLASAAFSMSYTSRRVAQRAWKSYDLSERATTAEKEVEPDAAPEEHDFSLGTDPYLAGLADSIN